MTSEVASYWAIIVNLLAGSLLGAWVGAGSTTRLRSGTFRRVIAALLIAIAAVLLLSNNAVGGGSPLIGGAAQFVIGIGAGFGIGIVAALLGVAGGELLIPTLILLFGVDIKLAGSLALAVSLPTMLTSFARYTRDNGFNVLLTNRSFALTMAVGSILGVFVGGQLLGIVPTYLLVPLLSGILAISAVQIWRE